MTSFGTTSAFSAAFDRISALIFVPGIRLRSGLSMVQMTSPTCRVPSGTTCSGTLSTKPFHSRPGSASQVMVTGIPLLHSSEFRLVDVDTNTNWFRRPISATRFSGIQVAAGLYFQPVQDAVHRAVDLSAREALRRGGRPALRFLQPGFRGGLVGLADQR